MRQPILTLSPDAPELTTDQVTKAYQEFPRKESEEVRTLKEHLHSTTIMLQAACYFIGREDQDFKDKFLAEIEKNERVLKIR